MSIKYLSLTLILSFLSLNIVVAQCSIDATVESNPSSYILTTNGNPKQSFVPCISGDVSSLKFQVTNATQSGSGTLSIVEGEGVGQVVASVPYANITFTDTGYTTVDLSGMHVPVDAGRIYSISFSTISNLRYHRYDDVYPDGGRFVGSTRVSDNDIVFELSIDPASDYFVNGSTGSDSNDGSDFANAFATIKKAIDTATPGSNVYVAAGTYLPTAGFDFDESGSIDAREFTFHIPTGYTLYGGFDGTETTIDLSARNFVANETILSGDLGAAGISDNAYHVVYTDNVSSNTLLNGFTIQDGNANGSSGTANTTGGGWYNDGSDGKMSSPQAVNLIIKNNTASNAGGFFNGGDAGTANPIFRSCVFDSNDATSGFGGAFYNSSLSNPIEANPVFYNCTFISNTAGHSGAAIASFGYGGGDFVNFETVNSIFYGNVAATPQFPSFNTVYLSQSDMSVHHSIFDDSSLPSGTTDDGDNLTATNPLFASEGGYILSNCSPAANAGDNSVVTESLDASGNVRLQNATVDVGAYEFTDPSQPVISVSQSTVDFGDGSESQILQETITISNTAGFGDLNIMVSIDGDAAFSINTAPSAIAEGATADLIIDYAPKGIYNQFAEVLIESNDCTQESITIDLNGEGVFTPAYTLAHGEPYQLGTIEAHSIRYITSLNNSLVHGMFISADGTKGYVLGSNYVYQMSMSTPFDITTATDDGNFSMSGEVSDATAMAFDPIGMRLFILGGTDLFQYSLTTAFDVMGTVSYDGSIEIPNVGQLPTGITFNQKGDRLLVLDNDQDRIQNYKLEFPYDIVNGTLTSSVNSIISSDFSVPQDLQLSANEKEIFVVEDGKLIQYRAFTNSNGIFPNNVGEKEIPYSSTFTADAKAIHYTPDSKHLYILSRTTTGSVRIRQLSFEREEFDEESINDGSISASAELFLTGTTFVNAGSSLVEGTHFSVTNLPVGLIPAVSVSSDGESATFTISGMANDHQGVNDVNDLSITFTDAAFDGVAADDIDVLGNNEYHITFRDNDITWDGSFDTNWNDARNWTPGRVPNINENAIIPTISSSFNRSPIIDNDQEINNLELSSISSTITLTEGKSLAIYGTVSGSGSLNTRRAVVGDLGYSVIGATVTDQTVADLTPNADFIYGYDGVSNVYSVPTVLDEGNGYFVAFDESSPTMTLSGKPVSGEVTRTVVFTANGQSDDFELVANPYNAAITRQSFVEENGPLGTGVIDGTIYLWQDGGANLPNGTRAGSYLTINASGTATGGTFDGYIRSGQGFFVAANSTIENTLSFTPSMQSLDTDANTTDGFFRKSEQKINISIAGNDQQDELILEFVEGASLQMDTGYDALKLMNSGLSFYSMMDETPLAIQTLPLFKEGFKIPIGLNVSVAGEYVISVSEIEGFANEEMIFVDLYTNQEYQLSSDLQIKLTLDEGKNESRFALVSQPSTVLSTNDQLRGLNIQRFENGIQITYESTKISEEVSIYTLSGTRIINQALDFKSGDAFIEMNVKEDQVYILRVGDASVKFVFK